MAVRIVHRQPFGESSSIQFSVSGDHPRIRTPKGAASITQMHCYRELYSVITAQAMPTDQCHRISNARQGVFQKNTEVRSE